MKKFLIASALLLHCCVISTADAENWPRFRGIDGAGVSSETGFPTTWGEDDYAWTVDLPGESHCSPIIWGNQVFVTAGLEEGKTRRLISLNAETGKENWRRDLALNTVHLHLKNSFASGSPVTDGKHVVASFADEGQFVVACWTVSGEELWRKDVGEFLSQHGPACTPIIHGDYVIVAKDMKGPSAVFAFDVETGAEKWKVDREFERTSYATPVVRKRADGREEVICVSDASGIAGLDLKTGEKLWESPDFPMRTVGSPVLTNGQVLCSSGSGGSGKLMQSVRLDQTGSLEPVWELSQRIPYVPTPVYKDGLLFSVLDRGMLACHNADTGEEVFVERVNGKFTGSPIWVEGRLYAIDEDGVVVVLAADETFQELGRVPLGQTSYSTPAVANGRMYLKTMSKLFCLPAK